MGNRKKTVWFTMLILLLSIFGCEKKRALLKLNLQAKTHQGDMISQALVLIDGKNIGETDVKGAFATEISVEHGARPKIEVRKESDTYYFAPYIDAISVQEEEVQVANVKATLYFVPKPKPMPEEAAKQNEAPAVEATSAQAVTANTSPAAGVSSSDMTMDAPGQVAVTGGNQEASASPIEPQRSMAQDPVNPMEAIPEHLPVATKAAQAVTTSSIDGDAQSHQVDELAARVVEKATQESGPEASGGRLSSEVWSRDGSNLAQTTASDHTVDAVETAVGKDTTARSSRQSPEQSSSDAQDAKEDLATEENSSTPNYASPSSEVATESTTKGPTILTVNVASVAGKEEIGIPGVEVLYADSREKAYKRGCATNDRGRCVIRFPAALDAPLSIMTTKKGFKTVTGQVVVKDQTKHKVLMERGLTLDIHALTRAYNHVEGLPQVDVLIENKKVGSTDRLGHFSYVFTGKREALVGITLKAQGYLPEVYETDFVASGPMSIVKYFASPVPPAVLVTVLSPMPAGNLDQNGIAQISGPIQEAVKISARKHFFSTSAFKEAPQSVIERAAKSVHADLLELRRKGWANTPLKSQLDVMMVPTIILGAKPAIEISMIDNAGQVMTAAREDLDGALDLPSIDRAFYVLAGKIIKGFPFEGAVVGKDADMALINIGHAQGRGVKAGDLVDVYGVQVERFGDKEKHKKIGTLTLREVFDGQSKGALSWMAPRALIERGDLVVLRPRRAAEVSAAQIHVLSRDSGKTIDVGQANIYLNGHWLGTTDEAGRLYADGGGSGTLRIVKHGFREQALDTKLIPKGRIDVVLARESAFIKIESRPSGATVFVEGKSLGRTPLSSPIPVPSGFIRIKLESGSGFKPYTAVLELDEGTLDLTGSRAITLETDYLAQASRLKKSGKNAEAAEILAHVPPTHSDYLMARFEAGELWLSVLDNPTKAEGFFAEVLADESVKSFADKRFIGAHINAGIAQFRMAETLQSQDPATARPYYQKSIEALDAVVPHIRHVSSDQYNQAVHTVDFYRALARHRLWTASQDPQMLVETVKTWRSYLEGDAKSLPPEGGAKALLHNAEVYFKQAVASLEVSKNTVQQ